MGISIIPEWYCVNFAQVLRIRCAKNAENSHHCCVLYVEHTFSYYTGFRHCRPGIGRQVRYSCSVSCNDIPILTLVQFLASAILSLGVFAGRSRFST